VLLPVDFQNFTYALRGGKLKAVYVTTRKRST